MLSHDCKAAVRSFIAVFDCNIFAIDLLLRTRNSFLTHFFMIFEAKNAQTLNVATTKPCFTAQNAAEVSQDTASWIQTLKSLAWGLAGRGLAKEAILQFWWIPNRIPKTCARMWHMLCEILDPCCLLVLYLLGRVFQKLHDRLQILMFLNGFSSCFWFLFQILWSVSPFSSSLSAACWFALWFQLCGQAILGLFGHMTWMILMDSMVFLCWEMIIF